MWCLTVINVIALLQSAQGGYEYPKPSIPFNLPNQALQNTGVVQEDSVALKPVSYSLPYDDYQYIQHTNEETNNRLTIQEPVQQNFEVRIKQDQPHAFLPQFINNLDATASIYNAVSQSSPIEASQALSENNAQLILNIENKVPPLIDLQNSEYIQNAQGNSNVKLVNTQNVAPIPDENNNVPPLIKLNTHQDSSVHGNIVLQSINIPNNEHQLSELSNNVELSFGHSTTLQNVNNVLETIQSPIINLRETVPQVLHAQNSVQTTISGRQNYVEQISNNQIFIPSYTNSEAIQQLNTIGGAILQNVVTPVITKSFSFHVPPPDVEDTPVAPLVLPGNKIYKIIFIKAPTQDYQYNQQLLSTLNSRLAPVEDKTLIYVISKNPEVLPEEAGIVQQPAKVSEHQVFYVQYKGDTVINSDQGGIQESISQLALNSAENGAIEPIYLNGH